MLSIASWTKPIHYVVAGRVVALCAGFLLGVGYVANGWTPIGAGAMSWVLAVSLLMGAPKQRGSELIGATAIWLSFAEFLSMMQTGHFDAMRWLFSVCALLVAVFPIRVSWNRQLANSHPNATFAQLDRRAAGWTPAMLPKSDDKLARLRGEGADGKVDGLDLASEVV